MKFPFASLAGKTLTELVLTKRRPHNSGLPRDEASKRLAALLKDQVGKEVSSTVLCDKAGLGSSTVHSIMHRMIGRGEAEKMGHGWYKILAPMGSKKKGVMVCQNCGHAL
jgi:hypothetical protein